MNSFGSDDKTELKLRPGGSRPPAARRRRHGLRDQRSGSVPGDAQARVLIYSADIAPGGYTNWHCHNGATFFVALQGIFEARFDDGSVLTAKAGDVYSEPSGLFHRGHNPHPDLPYLCIAFCLTSPDLPHVTNREMP